MVDLTPEEIALGLRAVKAGWAWSAGDIARQPYWHIEDAADRAMAIRDLRRKPAARRDLHSYRGRWGVHPAMAVAYAGPHCVRITTIDVYTSITQLLDTQMADAIALGHPRIIPDPTARGFVSAALAQVRERTGDPTVAMGRRMVCDDRGSHVAWDVVDRLLDTISRGDTEAEAVVAALEATR